MEFSNHGKTENKGKKEPLQIHICAEGRDLPLLRIDAAEKTVRSGTKPRVGKSRFLNLSVVFSTGYQQAWTGRAQSSQWEGAVAGKDLSGMTFLSLYCGLAVPWWPACQGLNLVTRGSQQPLPQTQLPAWATMLLMWQRAGQREELLHRAGSTALPG